MPPQQASNAAPVAAVALAEAARRAQLAIRAHLVRDVAAAWPALNFTHLPQTWPGWLQVMTALIGRYHAASADQAGLFYRAVRQAATGEPGTPGIVHPAPPPDLQWLTRALGYAAPGVYRKQISELGADPAKAGQSALTQVLGTASRIALDGSRSTIIATTHADDKAVGWYRVTDGRPCAFCALLASRGVVYKSSTVKFQAHNDCGCTGAPAFTRDQELPAVNQRAAQVYLERGPGPALEAFRKAWNAQQPLG